MSARPTRRSLAALGEEILSSKRLWDDLQSRKLSGWKDLRQRVENAALTVASFAAFRTALLQAAVEAYAESLQGEGVERWFHGKVTVQGDGQVVVAYDFSAKEQLEDFRPVGGGEHSLALDAGRLKLRGELRLLEGDPFVGALSISLVAQDFDQESPNINVALWTAESCPVTAGLEGDSPADLAPPLPRSGGEGPERRYLVLGLGYKPGGQGAARLRVPGERPFVCPADALILGVRGLALTPGARSECLWGKSLLEPLRGSQEVVISLDQDPLIWRVNKLERGSSLGPEARRRVQEFLRTAPTGSVTLFTNGGTVMLDSLTIEGRLNPQWSAARLRRRAIEELRKKAAGIPWQELDES